LRLRRTRKDRIQVELAVWKNYSARREVTGRYHEKKPQTNNTKKMSLPIRDSILSQKNGWVASSTADRRQGAALHNGKIHGNTETWNCGAQRNVRSLAGLHDASGKTKKRGLAAAK